MVKYQRGISSYMQLLFLLVAVNGPLSLVTQRSGVCVTGKTGQNWTSVNLTLRVNDMLNSFLFKKIIYKVKAFYTSCSGIILF